MSEAKIVGRNVDLEFFSTVGLRRDVIDAGGTEGTRVQITDAECQVLDEPPETITDAWNSYVESRRILPERATELTFRGVPAIHSLDWSRNRVEY